MEGDFVKACEMLKGLYPEQMFNAKDIATLNTLSLLPKAAGIMEY